MTVPHFQAIVSLTRADHWNYADTELLEATVRALQERRPELIHEPAAMSFETNIPRQVGLSGSSAIIMAALRAFAQRADTEWDLVELARTTLEIETQVLGWAAGPQDRVVQAFTGLLDMDFAEPWDASRYHRLDAAKLPPLFVAWDRSTGTPSDVVHSEVRRRWLDRDPQVVATMTRFAELAEHGFRTLDAGTAAKHWPALMGEAFDLRRQIWNVTDIDTALVQAGQRAGAGVAFAGSGGAVVGAVSDQTQLDAVALAYQTIDAGFLVLNPGAIS
jgi:glucuronokinase